MSGALPSRSTAGLAGALIALTLDHVAVTGRAEDGSARPLTRVATGHAGGYAAQPSCRAINLVAGPCVYRSVC